MLAGAQVAAQAQSVLARHHHVQHDQIHGMGIHQRAHGPATVGLAHAQAVALQVIGQHLADLAVIVDDQDVRYVVHCVLDEDEGQGRAVRPW